MARDIAAALGGFRAMKGNAYWESDAFVLSYAIGHLLELLEPDAIDPALKRWSLDTLPIVPTRFQLQPVEGHETRLSLLKELMERPDVVALVNACDAAREGELIFRELTDYFACRKPVKRLWLQSMTADAIRTGFGSLRDGKSCDGLGAAAACRARADWLIGMNATRAFSLRLRTRDSGPKPTPFSVGRVQTPTLALLVERELAILAHEPKPYWRIKGRFKAHDHEYDGYWFDPAKKEEADRIFEEPRANAIAAGLAGSPAVAEESREESLKHAPRLFHLTGLQKYMASRFKWTAKRTLDAAQRCYEQHKVITYPRTASAALPTDYKDVVKQLIDGYATDQTYGGAAQFLKKNGLRNERRTFDDAAVTDHFAIIPTGKTAQLAGDDEKVYDAVVRRLLATFFPPAVYDKVKRLTKVGKAPALEHFKTGPVETLLDPGWLSVYGKEAEEGVIKLPRLTSPNVLALSAATEREMTKPPPRHTEAGLLALMENAGRHVDDEELAQALMNAAGLGTAATRADIIQNLKAKRYVDPDLRPTAKGIILVTTLQKLGVARLTSPALTGQLELELAEVEGGKRAETRFMQEMAAYVNDVVGAAKNLNLASLYAGGEALGTCPECKHKNVYEQALVYKCEGCSFMLPKEDGERYVDLKAAKTILSGQKSAPVRAAPPARAGASVSEPIGPCPIHAGTSCQILSTKNAYVCERRLDAFRAGDHNPSGFLVQKALCHRSLSPGEIRLLATKGETGELTGFISKAGKPFAARLVLAPNGQVIFQFDNLSQPRTPRTPEPQSR